MDAASYTSNSDAIKVFLRVRPPEKGSSLLASSPVVEVNADCKSVTLLSRPDVKLFTFDHVADVTSTQDSVFSSVGKSLIESCVSGYNGTIFAYGQTGSGKTFTMLGPSEESDSFRHELRGLTPRSFEHLFNLIAQEQKIKGTRKQFLCKCSFLEIYQEQVFDLLDPTSSNLQLRESMKKGVFVDGLMEHVVTSPSEAYQTLSTGWINRRVAATSMNMESSRSHAVFTLNIESMEERDGVINVRQSQLNLVDLAGSERQKDTSAVGIRLKEGCKINQSLSVLGNVIMSLVKMAQGRAQHVPYRDSKLTFILRDSLGGNSRTSIVACIHPDARCFGETLSTLNFAKRAKQIKNKAVINEDTRGSVLHLQAEIHRLKEQLCAGGIAVSEVVSGRDRNVSPDPTREVSEWQRNFRHAMHFCDKLCREKEVLQRRVWDYVEDMRKMDCAVLSYKLIVKLRESTISKMETAIREEPPAFTDSETNRLLCEVHSLKAKLDRFPMVSQLDKELHILKAQLADLRLSHTAEAISPLDSNRLAELWSELQALISANRNANSGSSPLVSNSDVRVSLKKCRQRVARLEKKNDMTLTPTIDINMLRPRDAARLRVVDLDRAFGSAATGRSEDVDDDEVLVSDDKALAEENRTLLQTNFELRNQMCEQEVSTVHLRQRIGHLELENDRINEMLGESNTKATERLGEGQRALCELEQSSVALTTDLKFAMEELMDYKILLKSSDRELSEEKCRFLTYSAGSEDKVNRLETQVLNLQCAVETLEKQLENEIREQDVKEEKLEMERLERIFLDAQQRQLEEALIDRNNLLALSRFKLQISSGKEEELTARCHDFQRHLEEQEADYEARLKDALQQSYSANDVLTSEVERLTAECGTMKEGLAEYAVRTRELADFNAVLAGHANHHQKVMYVRKLQSDYTTMKAKYDEMAKEVLRLRTQPTALKDRTNVAGNADGRSLMLL